MTTEAAMSVLAAKRNPFVNRLSWILIKAPVIGLPIRNPKPTKDMFIPRNNKLKYMLAEASQALY
jgi:hypothetical protein